MSRAIALVLAGALFVGCTTTSALPSGRVTVDGGITIEDVDLNCNLPTEDRTTEEDERFIAQASTNLPKGVPVQPDANCLVAAYSRIPILQWDTIRDDIPSLTEDVTFTRVELELEELIVSIDGAAAAPAGSFLLAGQILASPSINLADYEDANDPIATALTTVTTNPFTIDGYSVSALDEVVFGLQQVFTGKEAVDLAPTLNQAAEQGFIPPNEEGLANFLNRAFDSGDETLYLLTVADATIPLSGLAEEPVDFSVSVKAELRYEGEVVVGFDPFSGGDSNDEADPES